MAFSLELLVRQFRMLAFISQRKHNGTETLVRYNVGVLSRFDLTEKVDQVNRVGDLNTVTLRHFLPHPHEPKVVQFPAWKKVLSQVAGEIATRIAATREIAQSTFVCD